MEEIEPGDHDTLAVAKDDMVLPFRTERGGARGRVVRLGSVLDEILTGHDYPEPVSELLGEAVALTAMFGASLKFEGNFILQTETDGPVDLLVVDFRAPGGLRGCARFDSDRIEALQKAGDTEPSALLGHGHLAMTIDQGPETDRYQGVVPLEGVDLSQAADLYFRQSEQLPTFVRVAVARHYLPGTSESGWTWRAGGLMVQHVTSEGGLEAGEDDPEIMVGEDDEDWNRVRILAETVEDHELLDPTLAPERLLYRLFHEERVRAYPANPLSMYCKCSEERIKRLLDRFDAEDLSDMVEDGKIIVTCEFCNRRYDFDADLFVGERG